MKEIFYYFGIMCFGYIIGTFSCFVYKWMKLGFDLVNEYDKEGFQKPIYTQEHYEYIQNLRKEESLFDRVNNIVKDENLFITNESGETKYIKLSHASGDNLIFKELPTYCKY